MFDGYSDVVTVKDLEKMLDVGRNTAYNLIKSGEVGSIKVKSQIRIPKESVIAFVKGIGRDSSVNRVGD
ncbi:hypothetical protein FACS189490_04820 [Clostridia bacterium]|nr:hypothetical protein FACS189490_04820 [Clostridia bacterium]